MASFIKKNQAQKTFASIDLGSNALRAVVARFDGKTLEIIRSIRIPLRLGEDVFKTGKISLHKIERTEEAFIDLLHLFVEYNVTEIRATATSAMRDAKNGKALSKRIMKYTGIELETISGNEEAELIVNAVQSQLKLSKKISVLMDIGGGSTEISIAKNGKLINSHSFNIGTVRLLHHSKNEINMRIKEQVRLMTKFIENYTKKKHIDYFIGTGGNLRRIGKIRKKTLGKNSKLALLSEINAFEEIIRKMSLKDRIQKLEMDPNRADVILPAIMITERLMERLKLKQIQLPMVGLKEGLLLNLIQKKPKKIKLLEEN